MPCGRDVIRWPTLASTPTIGVVGRGSDRAAGGVQIRAGHNPPPYNGNFKLFGDDGRRGLDANAGAKNPFDGYFAGVFGLGCPFRCDWIGQTLVPNRDPHQEHLEKSASITIDCRSF